MEDEGEGEGEGEGMGEGEGQRIYFGFVPQAGTRLSEVQKQVQRVLQVCVRIPPTSSQLHLQRFNF